MPVSRRGDESYWIEQITDRCPSDLMAEFDWQQRNESSAAVREAAATRAQPFGRALAKALNKVRRRDNRDGGGDNLQQLSLNRHEARPSMADAEAAAAAAAGQGGGESTAEDAEKERNVLAGIR